MRFQRIAATFTTLMDPRPKARKRKGAPEGALTQRVTTKILLLDRQPLAADRSGGVRAHLGADFLCPEKV
jgi:hypothetical protein